MYVKIKQNTKILSVLQVGDMISVIDMPPPEESIWWRGKRGFEVGFFPCECVEVIGDKVPHNLNLPHNSSTLPHPHTHARRDSSASESPSEPTKPVLRKHGKLITFFRSFILSRPARGKLKKSGILKERVFGCDLGEHLLNTGQDGELGQISLFTFNNCNGSYNLIDRQDNGTNCCSMGCTFYKPPS